jgi:3-hydroxybutyryl-CoA dehydrogenase
MTIAPRRAVIGVVGAGTMGAGIAQVALEAGHEVVLQDLDATALERARGRIREGLGRRAGRLGLDAHSIDAWVDGRLTGLRDSLTLDGLAAGADVVIEAALEELELKRTIFRALDAEAPPDAILATNTSALSVNAIADAVRAPGRVVGLHFFNPAPVMPLVEVVRGLRTEPRVVETALALMTAWGKTPVPCDDAPGFIVNRINRPFTLEALAMLDAGIADVATIDAAVREAGYPMGPFELMDLTGIDVTLATTRAIHAAFIARGDPLADRFLPSPTQERLVDEGRLGRKTGAGFNDPAPRDSTAVSAGGSGDASIVERIELAIVNEASRALEEGVASRDAIDLAMRLGAGHPAGPFERWSKRGGSDAIAAGLDRYRDAGPRFVRARILGA